MKPLKTLSISFLVCIMLTGIILVAIRGVMMLFVISEFLHFILIGLALLAGALRYGGIISKNKLFYIFIASANCWMGLFSIFLWATHHVNANMPITFLINLLAGSIMLIDTFHTKKAPA